MKRMKKKVVAMVTLAMFLMTLLPMAAFAGTPAENSITVENNKTSGTPITELEITDTAKAIFELKEDPAKEAEIWVENMANPGKAVANAAIKVTTTGTPSDAVDGVVSVKNLNNGATATIDFPVAGDFVVKVGAWVATKEPGQNPGKKFVELATSDVITVTGCKVSALSATASVPVEYKNGYQLVPVDVTATGAEAGALITINNAYANAGIKVVDAKYNVIDKAKLDNTLSTPEFYVVVDKYTPAGIYRLDLACNGAKGEAVITVAGVAADKKVATTIEAPAVAGIIANDKVANFEAVKVVVKDQNGNVMKVDELDGSVVADTKEPIMGDVSATGTTPKFEKKDYVKVTKKPAKSTLADNEVELKDGTDALVLDASDLSASLDKKFVPGDYAIEFVLKNGAKATATFTVGEFNDKDVKDLVIKSDADIIPVTFDQYGAPQIGSVDFTVYQVDANGIESPVDTNFVAAYVPAVNTVAADFTVQAGQDSFKAKYTGDVKEILGTKVTVTAFYKGKLASKEYTFAQPAANPGVADNKIVFKGADKVGKVLTDNAVAVELHNKNGKINTGVTFEVNTTPVKVSNKDAKVIVAKTGTGLTIYSDKPTTVDVQVLAWLTDSKDSAIYADTLSYTIGKEDVHAKTLVALTIGSKDMIVNNEVVKIDAAPYVDKNWRTMVPLSAITEAFGVTPEWNEADRTVTVEMNGVKVVMTIDKQAYTVNGEKKTMDTAPVIKNSRTMVPVRFIAEELGFTVAPMMTETGLTEGVIISK